MKRLLLITIGLVLLFISCEKKMESNMVVRYTPQSIKLDRADGGNAVVTAGIETYPAYIVPIKVDDYSMQENVVYFWKNRVPTAQELQNAGVYEAHGCKISLSNDFKQYTIEVEKDCEWDYLEVYTRWVDGYPAPSIFHIVLNPELYDYFRE